METDEQNNLVIPNTAALDLVVRQRYTILHALEGALHTCVTHEAIPAHVIWQALDELCAKTLATLATHAGEDRRDQLAYIGEAIQNLDYDTCSWLRELRGE